MSPDRADAERFDREDVLASLRTTFHIPRRANGSDAVYLCGHSLGLQPRAVAAVVTEELDRWARLGVDGHFESPRPWLTYHEQLVPGLARLAGAQPIEV